MVPSMVSLSSEISSEQMLMGRQEMANKTGITVLEVINTVFNTAIGTSDVADRNLVAGSFAFFTVGGDSIDTSSNVGTTVVNIII